MPIPKTKIIEKETSKDKAYRQIRDWIIDGTLEPNEKLAETSLAQAVGISRTPVREALLKLNEVGFVILATGKMTQVAPLDVSEAANLFLTMSSLEGIAAAQAVGQLKAADLDRLTKRQAAYEKAVAGGHWQQIFKADRAFHEVILQVADNPYVTQFSNQLYGHILRVETHYLAQQSGQSVLDARHHDVLTAMKNGVALDAKAAIESDWLAVMDQVQSVATTVSE
ncbi:GntR family transcriptional regulator [uncultured Secundilactobacillus sp.]|uniref:GntR family transcriptional regulator n=1 Tax=uncultured Secundilactobacillus sp. TaxID=2813935 RepID=UPI00258B8AEA|nr:GntR family transcriptional regulator [uncultured Secundilactobacillus sp.]